MLIPKYKVYFRSPDLDWNGRSVTTQLFDRPIDAEKFCTDKYGEGFTGYYVVQVLVKPTDSD